MRPSQRKSRIARIRIIAVMVIGMFIFFEFICFVDCIRW